MTAIGPTPPSRAREDMLHGARAVLEEAGEPLHVRELTRRLLAGGLWHSEGKTPAATVGARLYIDIKKNGAGSRFIKAGKATFALNPAAPPVPEPTRAASVEDAAPFRDAALSVRVSEAVTVADDPVVKKRLSFTDAAEDVLRRYGDGQPMHYREITKRTLEENLVKTRGKTPEATLYAQIIQENARAEKRGRPTRFVRHGKGLVGLSEWLDRGVEAEIAKHNETAKAEMLRQLRQLDPADFEQLIGELLRALGINDVAVTAYHGDKGIDAMGTYELGPGLTVSIAVQAKRQGQNVGRPVVQSLSGSLKPHQQGLIITTADFGGGARTEAERNDKPLIWLVNGKQLVEMLIANDLGSRRIPVELVEPLGFELGSGDET